MDQQGVAFLQFHKITMIVGNHHMSFDQEKDFVGVTVTQVDLALFPRGTSEVPKVIFPVEQYSRKVPYLRKTAERFF